MFVHSFIKFRQGIGRSAVLCLAVACAVSAALPVSAQTTGDDQIVGTPSDDIIDGLGGDDEIFGLDGLDILEGGSGDNRIFGGSGGRVDVNEVLVSREGDDLLDGGSGFDALFAGAGDDTLIGGSDGDSLIAGDDDDKLDGGSGEDRLFGNRGNDVYVGGADNDTFVYNFVTFESILGNSDQGDDTIEDFESGSDLIRVPGVADELDTNGNGQLDDGDDRVSADAEGERSLVIKFEGVLLTDGTRGAGSLTVIGHRDLAVGTEISFAP
jgi:Ca2+-binding RTX toxin-like protein